MVLVVIGVICVDVSGVCGTVAISAVVTVIVVDVDVVVVFEVVLWTKIAWRSEGLNMKIDSLLTSVLSSQGDGVKWPR